MAQLHLSPSEHHGYLMSQMTQSLAYDGGDVRKWQGRLRRKLRQLVGNMPKERCPLNPRRLWQAEHPLGSIEKIVFTSEPYSDVTAYVCLPKGVKPPYTFMICLQGHSTGMHNSIAVQREDETQPLQVEGDRDFALGCMQRGLAALCIEQRSFGERREQKQEQVAKHGCHDATMHALMLGRTLAGERVYDVDRGIDYLASRGDVRMDRLGVMGNSGGGTISVFSAALLPRLSLAMPSCYFCTFRDSIMSIYHCADNYIPGLLQYAEMADVLGLFAPKPVVVVAGQDDPIFPIAATRRAFQDLQRIYAACGAADRCHLVVGDGGHRFYAADAWPVMLAEYERLGNQTKAIPVKLSPSFPRYEEFAPTVPVWCVTPDRPGCIHRFFDTSPISPSGRYLAVFQFPFEDRQPRPGEAGQVCVVDLETGKDWVVSTTCGWEPQMGANVNWGATDHELYFNDVDTRTWRPFAWKADPLTGTRERMEGTVYHASSDGRWLISANMATMRKTQPGYGVVIPEETVGRNVGMSEDDGFYLTDTSTGKCRLLASLADLFRQADPAVAIEDPDKQEIYGFHSKFNPQSNRLMLSIRWFPAKAEPQWNLFKLDFKSVRYAWVTADLDGGPVHCAVGPEQWEKGGHHATWFPDGERISMNLNIDRDGLRFVQVDQDGSNLVKMFDQVTGSGHPTVHPDGKHLLTDTYTKEKMAYQDGTIPLRWVDLETGREQAIVRINTLQPHEDSVLRIDPHPAWDRTWRYVTFNAFVGGTRRVFLADLKSLLE